MLLSTVHVNEIILPAERQRQEHSKAKHQELKESIRRLGLLHAPIVRESPEGYVLVAGERRYRALYELIKEDGGIVHGKENFTDGTIPVLNIGEVEDLIAAKTELDENIIRMDLTWQERTRAIALLHKIRVEEAGEGETQTFKDTAEELTKKGVPNVSDRIVSRATVAQEVLTDEELAAARSPNDAFRLASQKLERQMLDRFSFVKQAKQERERKEQEAQHLILGDNGVLLYTSPETDADKFDVLITDPPYGIGVDSFGNASGMRHEYEEIDPTQHYSNMLDVADKWLKDDAHVYLFCDIDMWEHLKSLCEHYNFSWRHAPITWDKGSSGHLPAGTPAGFRRASELIFHAWRGNKPYYKLQEDVITVNLLSQPDRFHAAQKPDELFIKLLGVSCTLNDRVLDPYAGSGVVFAAAKWLQLKAVGYESNAEIARMTAQRRQVQLIEQEQADE